MPGSSNLNRPDSFLSRPGSILRRPCWAQVRVVPQVSMAAQVSVAAQSQVRMAAQRSGGSQGGGAAWGGGTATQVRMAAQRSGWQSRWRCRLGVAEHDVCWAAGQGLTDMPGLACVLAARCASLSRSFPVFSMAATSSLSILQQLPSRFHYTYPPPPPISNSSAQPAVAGTLKYTVEEGVSPSRRGFRN